MRLITSFLALAGLVAALLVGAGTGVTSAQTGALKANPPICC
jgi:hypothetical protein